MYVTKSLFNSSSKCSIYQLLYDGIIDFPQQCTESQVVSCNNAAPGDWTEQTAGVSGAWSDVSRPESLQSTQDISEGCI